MTHPTKKRHQGFSKYSRRRIVGIVLAVIAVLSIAGMGLRIFGTSNAATVRIFNANSFWYQPIPNDAPRHPNSNAMVADVVRQMKQYYGTSTRMNVKLNTYD